MKVNLIRIGNSRGIRIPKPLLEQCGLEEIVELQVRRNKLVVTPVSKPRSGWADAFKRMRKRGDDALLDEQPTTWERSEWRW